MKTFTLLSALTLLALSAAALSLAAPPQITPAPPAPKPKVIGFAQTGSESGWRIANTRSIQEEAHTRGYTLVLVDANSKFEAQLQAVQSFIDNRVDLIVLSPLVQDGWEPLLASAQAADTPVHPQVLNR